MRREAGRDGGLLQQAGEAGSDMTRPLHMCQLQQRIGSLPMHEAGQAWCPAMGVARRVQTVIFFLDSECVHVHYVHRIGYTHSAQPPTHTYSAPCGWGSPEELLRLRRYQYHAQKSIGSGLQRSKEHKRVKSPPSMKHAVGLAANLQGDLGRRRCSGNGILLLVVLL